MTPDEIDEILAREAHRAFPRGADEAMIQQAKDAILEDLYPVRPLAPVWKLTVFFVLVFALFAILSACVLGLHGLDALSAAQRGLIFPALVSSAWLAATACVHEMSPAAGRRLGALTLALVAAGFPILFALVFHDHSPRDLVKEGIPCLVAGLCVAIPAGVVTACILRRGFVLNWSGAGLAAGVLSGLAGLGMLELHCANQKAIHVIVWHVAVVLVGGMLGLGSGRIADASCASSPR